MKIASTLLTCVLACAAPSAALAAGPAAWIAVPPATEIAPPAAAHAPAWALSEGELDELAQAELQAADLEALHGGAITNDDLITILLIVGIVVLIAIIV
jgi:hypothetical protein